MTRAAHGAFAALIVVLGVAFANGAAADQRYEIEACGGNKPCVFVLDTETGEVRYCDTAGCQVLGAAEAAEKPSPFPFGTQIPGAGQAAEPFPLGEMGTAEPSVRDLLDAPAAPGAAPSPFPFAEPVPGTQ